MKGKKVIVGLSGGVDSSVALLLLKKQGFSPIGLTLHLPAWEGQQNLAQENICCTAEGIRGSEKLCLKLGVPYFVLDCRKEFKKIVVDYFVKEFRKGRTPNPCMICNKYFRFPKFFEFAKKQGALFVATGHYAKVRKNQKTRKFELLQAKDERKDQSYFLAFLDQKELNRLIFPLGNHTKQEVYQIAKKQGLETVVQRSESQDFCYVPTKYKRFFLEEELGLSSGPIVDIDGRVLAKHQGLHFYTIGQRKGIELPDGPFYVLRLDVARNAVIVTKNKRQLYQNKVIMDSWHFISGDTPSKPIKVMAKTRYRQPLAKATLFTPKKDSLELLFKSPQFAITPGQFAVFYKDGVCLGGGAIAS